MLGSREWRDNAVPAFCMDVDAHCTKTEDNAHIGIQLNTLDSMGFVFTTNTEAVNEAPPSAITATYMSEKKTLRRLSNE